MNEKNRKYFIIPLTAILILCLDVCSVRGQEDYWSQIDKALDEYDSEQGDVSSQEEVQGEEDLNKAAEEPGKSQGGETVDQKEETVPASAPAGCLAQSTCP